MDGEDSSSYSSDEDGESELEEEAPRVKDLTAYKFASKKLQSHVFCRMSAWKRMEMMVMTTILLEESVP